MTRARFAAMVATMAVTLAGCGASHHAGRHTSAPAHAGARAADTAPTGPHPDLGPFAGYDWYGDARSVHAAWTVPRLRPGSVTGEAATWIGVEAAGSTGHAPFVQVGVNEGNTAGPDPPFYYAFYSTTKLRFHPVHLFDVLPGDDISATLRRSGARWQIVILDRTSSRERRLSTVQGAGRRFNEAQYTQEDVTSARTHQPLPYPSLSPVRIAEVSVDGNRPRAARLDPSWLTEPDGYLAPGPLRDGAFRLSHRTLGIAGVRYLQAMAAQEGVTYGAMTSLLRWASGGATGPAVTAARRFTGGLRQTIAKLGSVRWPANARTEISAMREGAVRLTGLLAAIRAVGSGERLPWAQRLSRLVVALGHDARAAGRALRLPAAATIPPTG
jgi:Peptidase A4 family